MVQPIYRALISAAALLGSLTTAHAAESFPAAKQRPSIQGVQLAQGFRSCDPNCGSTLQGSSREAPGSKAHFFRTIDINSDGKVSPDEFRGPPQRFKFIDSDDDGFITKEEFSSFQKRQDEAGPQPLAGPSIVPNLPVLATHTHIFPFVGRRKDNEFDWSSATKNAVATMDKLGIRTAVTMPPPDPEDQRNDSYLSGLLEAAKKHPERFAVVGGGATLNGMIHGTRPEKVTETTRARFTERAEEIIRSGAVGFGEMTALHFSLFNGHAFEEAQPDHPLYLLLVDIAAKHDVPIDFHMEAVSRKWTVSDQLHRQSRGNPQTVEENITRLERLLAHNRKAKIIWVHVGMDSTGQRTVALTRRLLKENSNLFLSITGVQQLTSDNWFFKPGVGLNPEWRELILEFPDRFMIGTEAFFLSDNPSVKLPQVAGRAIATVRVPALPPKVRRKVAFENAQRLYKLNIVSGVRPADSALTATPKVGKPTRRFLSEAEIRQTVIGNTLNFQAPSNGQNLYVHFAEDGSASIKAEGRENVVTKKWFINDKGMLCRTFGKANKNHCTKVQSTSDPRTVTLLNKKVRYQATLIDGRKLPQ